MDDLGRQRLHDITENRCEYSELSRENIYLLVPFVLPFWTKGYVVLDLWRGSFGHENNIDAYQRTRMHLPKIMYMDCSWEINRDHSRTRGKKCNCVKDVYSSCNMLLLVGNGGKFLIHLLEDFLVL